MPSASLPIHPDQSSRPSSFEGIPIREDSIYSNARGKEKSGIRKRAEKLLGSLRDVLLKILSQDETILYVARAQAMPSALEQFFLGWLASSMHGGVLILTNRRLLYLILDRRGAWKQSVRAALWGDIQKAQAKGGLTRTLLLKYQNGSKEVFWRLSGEDAGKIKMLLAALLPKSQGETSTAHGMEHVCPKCLAPLESGVYACPKCGERFKDEKTLVRRSWLPGLGYSYVGQAGLAVLDFIIEAFLLLEIAVRVILIVEILRLPRMTPRLSTLLTEYWILIGWFAAIWIFKRWLVLRHCRRFVKEFIPAGGS